MTAVTVLAIGVFWGAVLTFALSLARAAGKPAPKPVLRRDDEGFEFEWPHPWTPGEVADASYHLGFEGGRSAERRERAS